MAAEHLARTYLTFEDVVGIHDAILEKIGGLPGFLTPGYVHAAVGRLQTGYYANIFEEAAALMESLANNHGFVDGNKRTGFTAADTFLRLNGFYMRVETEQAYKLITTAMDPKKFEHGFKFDLILEWIFQDYERL
jgi:death-on-curing protein